MKKASSHGTSEKEGARWGGGEFANMPKDSKMKPYPKASMRADSLDDTITGIDSTVTRSVGKSKSHVSNQH